MRKPLLSACVLVLGLVLSCGRADALEIEELALGLSFEEGQGAKVEDLSPNGNDGDVMGPEWADGGRFGGSLLYDGMDDFVEVPDADSLNIDGAMSVLFWINYASIAGEQNAIQKLELVGAPAHLGWFITKLPGHTYRFGLSGDAGRHDHDTPALNPVDGEWNQVVALFDGDFMKFYWNNEVVNETDSANAEQTFSAGDPVKIGARGQGGQTFFTNGIIDEVAIVPRAVTEDEVDEHFNNSLADLLAVDSAGKAATTWASLKALD